MTSYDEWKREFAKITAKYIKSINWETVIWEEGEISQAGDDLQNEAYININESDISLSDWDFYSDSCEDRLDFEQELLDRWEDTQRNRGE